MPLKNWLSYLLPFLLLIPACPAAPRQQISFSSLTTDDGLSQISVNDIYIDEFGAIWIGTREGLNRYDGNGIETYKLEKGNPASLFCNTILRITGNHDGKLGTDCRRRGKAGTFNTDRFKVSGNAVTGADHKVVNSQMSPNAAEICNV